MSSRFTPPSIAPTSGTPSSTFSLSSLTVGCTVFARSHAAYAATAVPETRTTAAVDATTFATDFQTLCARRRPCRATEGVFAARREVGRGTWGFTGLLSDGRRDDKRCARRAWDSNPRGIAAHW